MRSNKYWSIIGVLFLLAAVSYLMVSGQYIQIITTVHSMNKFWLLLALVLTMTYWFFEAKILDMLIENLYEKRRFRDSFKVSMIGQFFSGITPFATGGQPAQLMVLKKQEIPMGMGSTILMSKFVVYQAILVVYAAILLILKANLFLTHIDNLFILVVAGFGINLAVIFGLIFLSLSKNCNNKLSNFLIKILYKINIIKNKKMVQLKIANNIDDFHHHIGIITQHKLLIVKMILLTVLQLTSYFVIPYCLYRGFGLTGVSIINIIAATSFVLMVTSFIPMPGGSGGAEGGFYIIFGMFFIGKYILPAVLIWRLITYYMWMLIGGIWMLSTNGKYARS